MNRMKNNMMNNVKPQHPRGIALILVLWIITLLTVIALSFAHTMRTDVNIVTNSLARVKAETLADAAIQRAIYELYKQAIPSSDRWYADGSSRDWPYHSSSGDIVVTITMQDETGRIDVNVANDQLLKGLFLSQGVLEEDAVKLVDAIGDWRDADSLKRLHGAEAPEYTAAGLNYAPANAPFQAVEELKLVLGMTPDLYNRIAPLITVYSRLPGINERIATRDVLKAIPNVTDEQIDEYLARRDIARATKQPIPNFPQNLYPANSNAFTPVRIRTDALFADGNRFVREVVVRRYNDPKRPYVFLSWKEGRDLPVLPAAVAAASTSPNSTSTATLGKLVSPGKAP